MFLLFQGEDEKRFVGDVDDSAGGFAVGVVDRTCFPFLIALGIFRVLSFACLSGSSNARPADEQFPDPTPPHLLLHPAHLRLRNLLLSIVALLEPLLLLPLPPSPLLLLHHLPLLLLLHLLPRSPLLLLFLLLPCPVEMFHLTRQLVLKNSERPRSRAEQIVKCQQR